MKGISLAIFFLLFQPFTATADDVIKEVDYPVHYEVLSTSKTSKLVIGTVCSMTLRDQADVDVIISVSRTKIGSCRLEDTGKVYNGRQDPEKNALELVIPVGEDKARIEKWRIDAIVRNPH